MKRGFLILSVLIGLLAGAQPVSKLYAYSQVFIPGMIPQRDISEEPGRSIIPVRTNIIYYIYVKHNNSTLIQPKQIWIKGKWYKILRAPLVKTPIYSDQPGNKLLVPSTGYKVIQLQLGDSLAAVNKLPASVIKLKLNAELILAYNWKGNTYYSSVKNISELEPVHGL